MLLNHPVFDKMKKNSLWTVSSPKNKMPLDLQWLMSHYDEPNAIRGAKYQDKRSLGTYAELETTIPNHTNATYFYKMEDEDYLLLDIEPKCPDHIKEHLLQLPYVYAETSMSGKGYHLLLPKPNNINDYPDALVKVQLQEEHGWFELLVNHYVTFTGKQIDPPTKTNDFTNALYKSLAEHVVATKSIQLIDSAIIDIDDIPHADYIIELVMRKPFDKTPDDYNEVDDFGNIKLGNKYEFGMMSYYAHRIYQRTLFDIFKGHTYSEQELLSMLYHIIQEELPSRPKHDEVRHDADGNPIRFLLWRCNAAMANTLDFYNSPKKK